MLLTLQQAGNYDQIYHILYHRLAFSLFLLLNQIKQFLFLVTYYSSGTYTNVIFILFTVIDS